MNGTATDKTYDPLMEAHLMISGRAIQMGGLYLMSGDYCPICEVMTHMDGKPRDPTGRIWRAPEIERAWIDGPADAVLEYCQERDLVAPKQ